MYTKITLIISFYHFSALLEFYCRSFYFNIFHQFKKKRKQISNSIFRNPLAQLEEEKREHDNKMKKMETEMEQVFEMKVREKKQKLKDSEADVSFFFFLNFLFFYPIIY